MITTQTEDEQVGTTLWEVDDLLAAAAAGTTPEWIELIPAGEFKGRDGRGPYCLDDPAKVIEATRALQMDAGQPIDYDHATDLGAPSGRPAPAAGWIKELAVRAGALWGRVEWTRHGAEALTTREYRYVSPVFEHDGEGAVVRLIRAALTNNPNLYLKAIAAKQASDEANQGPRLGEKAAQPDEASTVRAILGLATVADTDEVVTELRRVRLAAEQASLPGRGRGPLVAMRHLEETATELNELRAERARERAERAVLEAMQAGKLTPAQRAWANDYCSVDPSGFQRFIERQPAVRLGVLDLEGRPPRAGAATRSDERGGDAASPELSANEIAICAQLGIRIADYARRRALPDEAKSRYL